MTESEKKQIAKSAIKMSALVAEFGRDNCGVDAWQRGQEQELPRGVKYGFYHTRGGGFVTCFVRPAA